MATPEHPFYVEGEGWVAAGELERGDRVRRADGSYGEVKSLRLVERKQRMYNLTVDEAHTYFVDDGQWLVHNTCDLRDEVARIRQAQPGGPIGAGRNVAVAEYNVNGQTGFVGSVSGGNRPGMAPIPTNPRFTPTEVGWLRSTDSEYKILEDIAARFGPDATGMVRIYSERPPCPSCEDVFRQFREAYPGINLIVDHGP